MPKWANPATLLAFVGVFGADRHQLGDVFIRQAVIDHTSFSPRMDEFPIPQEAQLVADGRHGEIAQGGQITYAQLVNDVEGVKDPQAGWVREGREKPGESLHCFGRKDPFLNIGHTFRVNLVYGTDVSRVFFVAHVHIVPEGAFSVNRNSSGQVELDVDPFLVESQGEQLEDSMAQINMRGGNYAAELQAPEVYRKRRRRLREALDGGTAVLWGNGDDRGAGDVGTFRQTSAFFYLTGVELPNAVLVLRDDGDSLFLPPRDPDVERWTGPKWGPGDEAAQALGFDQVLSLSASSMVLDARIRPVPSFEGRLQDWLCETGAALWTEFPSVASGAELPATHRLISTLKDRTASFGVGDLSGALDDLRLVKDEGEVVLMRRAAEISTMGHRAAARAITPGVGEGVIDGVVYGAFRGGGAEGLAFPSIVGSGFNATTLHYDQNVGICSDGELVVVDIGARYGYYCGDVTRTYPVNGSFSQRQKSLYDLVLEAHDRVEEAIKPGGTIFDLRKIAYGVFQESGLRDSKGERLGRHFIHGLGHFLGLDAHDPGGDSVVLEPGMVITNEPGLYLQDEGVGIRIEDDYVVTSDGAENLSGGLPTQTAAIEEIMR